MRNIFLKRVMLLVLVVAMMASAMAVSVSAAEKEYTYLLTIKTSDVAFAGTDSDVYVRVYDEYGRDIEGRILIDTSGDSFEKNSTDVVTINTSAKIANLSVSVMDNHKAITSWSGDWHIKDITAELFFDDINNVIERKIFHFNKWAECGNYYDIYSGGNGMHWAGDNHRLYEHERICFPDSVEIL